MTLKRNNILFFLSFAKYNWKEYIVPFCMMVATPILMVWSATLIEQALNDLLEFRDFKKLVIQSFVFLLVTFAAFLCQNISKYFFTKCGIKHFIYSTR